MVSWVGKGVLVTGLGVDDNVGAGVCVEVDKRAATGVVSKESQEDKNRIRSKTIVVFISLV